MKAGRKFLLVFLLFSALVSGDSHAQTLDVRGYIERVCYFTIDNQGERTVWADISIRNNNEAPYIWACVHFEIVPFASENARNIIRAAEMYRNYGPGRVWLEVTGGQVGGIICRECGRAQLRWAYGWGFVSRPQVR